MLELGCGYSRRKFEDEGIVGEGGGEGGASLKANGWVEPICGFG